MKTVALLTDFGLADNFVGVIKGVILSINPRVNIVDISHSVAPHDISGGAFLLKNSFRYFPKGCIFLVVVDPGVGSARKPVIIRTKDYFFVGPDNGVLSLAANEDTIEAIVLIEDKRYFLKDVSDTFHGRDIFAPVAAYISKGKRCTLFGRSLDSIKELDMPMPKVDKDVLKAEVIHIDRFGNLVTNIDNILFHRFTQNKKFEIKIKDVNMDSIARSYQDVRRNLPLAIFGSSNFLEISVNNGSAKEYFNAEKGTPIEIARLNNPHT